MDKIDKFKLSIEPNECKLSFDGNIPNASIKDGDSDSFVIKFSDNGCAEVDAGDYSYLKLTRENLLDMVEMIDQAEVWHRQNPS
jgi:hypothetical protein